MGETNAHTFSAVRGHQAGTSFYIAMCSLKSVARMFTFTDADIPAEHRAQRVLRKSRIHKIRDYILQNPKEYVFSSIAVSVDGKITFVPTSKDNPEVGTISILQDCTILINDGQHRASAIKNALEDNPRLGRDKISVVFFEDLDLRKSQQMFADLNKHAVKPTKSLGILYDHRNDFSSFVVEMAKTVPAFHNRTEMEKTSISNRSTKFFTLNGLDIATKNLLGKNKHLRKEEAKLAVDFWTEVGNNIPEWALLINNKVVPSELRKDYVHANTNMLEAIALAGNELVKKHPKDWKKKLVALQKIDWSRTNPEWQNKIIINGRMTKTKDGMRKAARIILRHCGSR